MAITAGQIVRADDFIDESERDGTPANDEGRVAKLEDDGKISNVFITQGFGDGSDGNVTIGVGTTTLTRDMYYQDLVITGTLITNGYSVYVNGTVSGAGNLKFVSAPNNGTTGGSGAGGASQGAKFKSKAGSQGGSGSGSAEGQSGNDAEYSIHSGGGRGGGGGRRLGGSGSYNDGADTANSTTVKIAVFRFLSLLGLDLTLSTGVPAFLEGGGGGGGGGAATSSRGGGGGESGGLVHLVARFWAGTFTISAPGGNGGNGSGDAGGGGGGGGGTFLGIYETKTWSGSYNLSKGTGGTLAGTNTSNGHDGADGTAYEIQIGNLT